MSEARRRKALPRADRVVPGVWRLRLPLPWEGVPHGNAWAVASGSGVVLFDTGYYEPGSMRQLELALEQAGLRLEHVRLLVCTHAHTDHYGQAAPIVEAAGCELWMHPNYTHMERVARDPEQALERRIEVGRQSGVPEAALSRYRDARRGDNLGVAKVIPPDRELLPGVEIETDLGTWHVYETPGQAPAARCLHHPHDRVLKYGDHHLRRVSLK
jgi:glyoxylase-like metal-dependent hydrolase (beta-lactamase superfamily II)